MAVVNKTATSGRGSGVVTPDSPHRIKFQTRARIISFMAQASAGQTIKIRYTLDDSGVVLWYDWVHGIADDSQVWATAFEGGLYMFEVSGTGNYSYSWD